MSIAKGPVTDITVAEILGATISKDDKPINRAIRYIRLSPEGNSKRNLLSFEDGSYISNKIKFISDSDKLPAPSIGELSDELHVNYSVNSSKEIIKTLWKVLKTGKISFHSILSSTTAMSKLLKWSLTQDKGHTMNPVPKSIDFTDKKLLKSTNYWSTRLLNIPHDIIEGSFSHKSKILAPLNIFCPLYDEIHRLPFLGYDGDNIYFYKGFINDLHNCPDFCEHQIISVNDSNGKVVSQKDVEGPIWQIPFDADAIKIVNSDIPNYPVLISKYYLGSK